MVDPAFGDDTSPDRLGGPGADERQGPARWQVVVGILALVALVVVGLLLVTGGHGPSQHGAPATSPTGSGPR